MNNIPWLYRIYRLARCGIDLTFPPVGGGCGKTGKSWCPECQSRLPEIINLYCDKRGIPVEKDRLCQECESNPPAYRKMRSLAVFDSPIQNVLHTLKYCRNVGTADSLAAQIVVFVRSLNWDVDVPVPLGKKKVERAGV